MKSEEDLIFMARVAESAERFDDMINFLNPILKIKGGNLSEEERNLLSVAFRNFINPYRNSLRVIDAILGNSKYLKFASSQEDYKKKI